MNNLNPETAPVVDTTLAGTHDTPTPDGAGNQPGHGDGGQQQPGTVTLTQAQIDDMINRAFAKGAAKAEKNVATQQTQPPAPATTAAPKDDPVVSVQAAETRLAEAQAQNLQYERRFAAMDKAIPADKADKYVRLAESYLGEDGDFGKALDAALVDFPLPPRNTPPAGGAVTTGTPGKTTKLPGQIAAEKTMARQNRAMNAAKAWTER